MGLLEIGRKEGEPERLRSVGQINFSGGVGLTTKARKERRAGSKPQVDMATAIGNPWRCRILGALALKDMSPSAFVREYGGEISNISRHFRQLASWGYLDVA